MDGGNCGGKEGGEGLRRAGARLCKTEGLDNSSKKKRLESEQEEERLVGDIYLWTVVGNLSACR